MTGDDGPSLATGQRSLGDPDVSYPLFPPETAGCPATSTDEVQYPLEVDYDDGAVDPTLFEGRPAPGLERWAPLLPPLSASGLGEGGTPLLAAPDVAEWLDLDVAVHLKDESQNPTWSQKDRLVRPIASAAVHEGARGLVVSSSGNHGASVAAYAARNGLDSVVLTSPKTPPAVQEWIASYGAAVVCVEDPDERRRAVDRLAAEYGFHPASTRTPVHTGHPFGPEGYKTIAYEVHAELGVPGTVAVPTCFAEILYGVWKGFRELDELGIADGTPQMVACEPAVRAPLAEAMSSGETVVGVDPAPTEAYSIKATTSTYRGRVALEESDGIVAPFSEADLATANRRLARGGTWQEDSGAAGFAGLKALVDDGRADDVEGPVVAVATASGFKDGRSRDGPRVDSEWSAIREALRAHPDVEL
ncbi:threonine synthase [Halobacteriales archaeon QS_8_69_26]|nr:MAG: threonine synthase [Halobacteriales archaeon QS_8_69_26]